MITQRTTSAARVSPITLPIRSSLSSDASKYCIGSPVASLLSQCTAIGSATQPMMDGGFNLVGSCYGVLEHSTAHRRPINLRPIYLYKPARSFEWTRAQSPFSSHRLRAAACILHCTRALCGALFLSRSHGDLIAATAQSAAQSCGDRSCVLSHRGTSLWSTNGIGQKPAGDTHYYGGGPSRSHAGRRPKAS
jgi:hypothetical protein